MVDDIKYMKTSSVPVMYDYHLLMKTVQALDSILKPEMASVAPGLGLGAPSIVSYRL